jgi:tetratricopeptide (TPR) repeat protein
MSLGDTDSALKELITLKDLAPDEAMVHFLLGRLYKSTREKGLAVRHFTIALNLDPKVCFCSITVLFKPTHDFRPVNKLKKRSKV